jgi:RNA polymerase sigma factor (sigma-70 family)
MMTTDMMAGNGPEDAELVARSLAGDREAFGQIVARYQGLVCSLAYSATGSLTHSEDLAQETFVSAWKDLRLLREPLKLRSWLCRIARNRIVDSFRREGRQPVALSEPLENVGEAPGPGPSPSEQAISQEEEAILWRVLERLPELYREPLVLFYREHKSIGRVAADLELSEDAVKQRLLRGRKLLQEEVLAFVEGALERTSPGKAFTLGVVAALPALALPASAATVGTAAAKGAAAAKTSLALGSLGALLGPVIGVLGGTCGAWASIHNTKSPRERQFMVRMPLIVAGYASAFLLALLGLIFLGRRFAALQPVAYGCAIGLLVLAYAAGLLTMILRSNRRQRQIQIEDGTYVPPGPLEGPPYPLSKGAVYGSLGGSITGALAWLILAAVRTHDWVVGWLVALAGALIFFLSSREWLRRPERRAPVWRLTLAALCVVTLLAINLRWQRWGAGIWAREVGPWPSSQLGVNIGLILLYVILGLCLCWNWKTRSGSSGRQ